MPVQQDLKDVDVLEKQGEKYLNALLKQALKQPGLKKYFPKNLGKKKIIIELSFVTNAEMKKLNASWRGKKTTTDILSFPMPKLFMTPGIVRDLNEVHLGELVICVPVLKSQAREEGHIAERELQVLLTHGLLHLLGFDHELGEKEALSMKKWEDKLLPQDWGLGLISRSRKTKSKS